MSAKNPLSAIKEKLYEFRRKAYNIKKITDLGETVEYAYTEARALFSPLLFEQAIKGWIRDLFTSKIEQVEHEQLDLWKGEYFWPIKTVEQHWAVEYDDRRGQHHSETFETEAEADARVLTWLRLTKTLCAARSLRPNAPN